MKTQTTQTPRQGMSDADRAEAEAAVITTTAIILVAFLILAGICKACER